VTVAANRYRSPATRPARTVVASSSDRQARGDRKSAAGISPRSGRRRGSL